MVYDLFVGSDPGEEITLSPDQNRRILPLRDLWGLDLRRVGTYRYVLMGEWLDGGARYLSRTD
jgi:hypothetical protein